MVNVPRITLGPRIRTQVSDIPAESSPLLCRLPTITREPRI